MIKAVIFDMGGVCVRDTRTSSYTRLAKTIGGITPEQLEIAVYDDRTELQKGKIDIHEFWSRASKALNKEINAELMEKTWTEAYVTHGKKNSEVESIVSSLKGRYRLAMLSNTIKIHSDYNRRTGRYSLFDVIVLSDEVGLRKPEREIYELTLRKLELEPEDCIFIDDVDRNLEPARSMGIKTILFKSAEQLKQELLEFGVSFN